MKLFSARILKLKSKYQTHDFTDANDIGLVRVKYSQSILKVHYS